MDDAQRPTVLLATEGTYPYHPGGVSTWCDTLVRNVPDTRFIVFAVVMNPYVARTFELPPSVERVISVPLWGTQDPSEHRTDLPFSEIFLRKQRTTAEQVERTFLPLFATLLEQFVQQGANPQAAGEALAGMYRFFQFYDYQNTFKTHAVWAHFRERMLQAIAQGVLPEPTMFDLTQALGWIYRFLIVLNTPLPAVDVTHASAAAFCGVAGIVGKVQNSTPYLLTEHGVYLREQYLSISRNRVSPFSKRFLISLIQTMVRTNLYFADELAPVCRFNVRWERMLGASPRKVRVIYNGVSPATFVAGEPRPESERLVVLSVARSDPNKDLETLLQAAAIVHQQLPQVCFRVVGSISVPDYHQRVLQLRSELGLESTVEFAGHTAAVVAAYHAADIVVQSSVSEGFPYSVIEAMMVGKPIVATDVGGTREALGDTGLLVPARDPARLAVAILWAARDADLRRRMAASARERALRLFATEHTVAEFHAAYRHLATAGRIPLAARRSQELALTRGYALLRLGHVEAALAQFELALRADPRGPMGPALLAQMGTLRRRLGREAEGRFDLERARLLERLTDAS